MVKQRVQDEARVKEEQTKRKNESRAKQRAENCAKVKEDQVKWKKVSLTKQRVEDEAKVKEEQNKRKRISIAKQREHDDDTVKEKQNRRKRLSTVKRKVENHDQLKYDQNQRQEKHRRIENKSDRLREFREATKYNAIFICTCCQQRVFHSNVRQYTIGLEEEINKIKPGLKQTCIERIISTYVNGKDQTYICLTCVRHMKKKKIPPMSAMNGLQLFETDKMILKQGLKLTELEGALIAKSIIFQKIYQLPKSRWTALKDILINITINDEDIINTLEQMPRTPKDAGLIGVALKRKREFKNAHKHQLVDPNKLFKMLDKLKKNGNKYYQFYDDYNDYQERCKISDPAGYEALINDEIDEVQGKVEAMSSKVQDTMLDEITRETLISDDDENNEEKEEIEYERNDPIKKFQFEYNNSLCMANKYPEISVNEADSVSVAPGEGKIPRDIMSEKDWDVKAFPHLNNPDGSNGKDQETKARLTDQNFFIHRICNVEQRFSRSPAYML